MPLDGCGATCRRAVAELAGGEAVQVTVAGESGGTQEFALPQLPAPPGHALRARATRRMRALETYRIEETLGPADPPLHFDYAVQAPDRLRFENEPVTVIEVTVISPEGEDVAQAQRLTRRTARSARPWGNFPTRARTRCATR